MAEGRYVGREPLVSIITINYNQAEVTAAFLASSRRLRYPNYEIIVVDNGSRVTVEEVVRREANPRVRLLLSPENLGFTGGNNLGMKAARGEFFFIVNNDTELNETLLDDLMAPFADPAVGVVCPKIRYFSEPDRIQYAGYGKLNAYTGQVVAVGTREQDHGQYDEPGPTHYAHGAAMMVRRSVAEAVGLFAEEFFLCYEELDWSARIRRAGYTIFYQPPAVILHKESTSIGKASPLKVYYHTRNRILFMRRNTGGLQWLSFLVFFCLLAVPKHLLLYTLRGQWTHLRSFVSGLRWNLSYRPA
ncbi:glycosyltransferase family 2 protein [Tellurirhabdus rosea]|uniref:glycosyltransferase family 2 protein n=1 Tax=Tellurirhabdus rosea TaxID=2674997 RepID=UPI002253260E|nr:glycosyltransferase family 2 protein [Tellurirhabdus rosea]